MKCGKPATVEYVWAMERRVACHKHAEQIGRLAKHMGWPFDPRFILNPQDTCPNELSPEEEAERHANE